MHDLRVEHLQVAAGKSLAATIVPRIAERSYYGKIIIVADKPASALPTLRKQWLRAERKLWKTRAQTIGASRIREPGLYAAPKIYS